MLPLFLSCLLNRHLLTWSGHSLSTARRFWHLGDPACPILGWAALITENDRVPGRWPRRWPLGIVLYRIYLQLFPCGLILCIHLWKVCVSLSKDGLIDPWDKLSISKQTTQCIRSLKLLKKFQWYPHYKWTHRKLMDTGPRDGLVPPCNKPLPEPIL